MQSTNTLEYAFPTRNEENDMANRQSISFRVEDDLKRAIETYARSEGVDRSVAIEKLVRRGLASDDQSDLGSNDIGDQLSQMQESLGALAEQIQSLHADVKVPWPVPNETDTGIRSLKMLEELRELTLTVCEQVATDYTQTTAADSFEDFHEDIRQIRTKLSSNEDEHDRILQQLRQIGKRLDGTNRSEEERLLAELEPSEPLGRVIHLLLMLRDDLASSVNCLLIYGGRKSPYAARKWVDSIFDIDYLTAGEAHIKENHE
jgi:hypothetical protein